MAKNLHVHGKIVKVTPGKLSRYVNDELEMIPDDRMPASKSTLSSPELSTPGVFKLYINNIRLSKKCKKHVKENLQGAIFLELRWNFFSIIDTVTSLAAVGKHHEVKFDFTAKYGAEVDEDFIKTTDQNPITLGLFATDTVKRIFLGLGEFFIENMPQMNNRKQDLSVYIINLKIDSKLQGVAIVYGWYKFTCNQSFLNHICAKTLNEVVSKPSVEFDREELEDVRRSEIHFDDVSVTNSEINVFQDGLLLVLNRNKALKTTQSEISNELKDRVRWLQFEANWKQTLQENAILQGTDPEAVHWRQWREDDTANVRLRGYKKKSRNFKPVFTITINKLWFLKGSAPLKDESVKQIYIEYTFLEHEGPGMETPSSYPIPREFEKLEINFVKSFNIDLKSHYQNCRLLTEMIKNGESIKFVVISEPFEDPLKPIQTCREIAFADVNLTELMQLEENKDVFNYEVVDFQKPISVVGYMTLTFDGILAVRNMALTLLSPPGYTLMD